MVTRISDLPTMPIMATRPVIVQMQTNNSLAKAMKVKVYKYIDNVSHFVVSYSQYPDIGTTNIYTFDLQEVVEDQLGYNLQEVGAELNSFSAPNALVKFDFAFYEMVISNNKLIEGVYANVYGWYVLNAARQHMETQSLVQYNQSVTMQADFLTSKPDRQTVELEDSEFLSAFCQNLSGNIEVEVRRVNNNISQYLRRDLNNAGEACRYDIPIGPANLNAYSPGFITAATSHYYVRVLIRDDTYNYFRDADIGTFNSLTGIGGPDDSVTRAVSNTHVRSGANAMRCAFYCDDSGDILLWNTVTPINLLKNREYEVYGYVLVEATLARDVVFFIELLGLADADILSSTVYDYEVGDAVGTWKQLHFRFRVGDVTMGRIEVKANTTYGPVGVVYFDDFKLVHSGEIALSKTRTYVLNNNCKEGAVRVHWLNRLGAIDSYTFAGERKAVITKSGTYQKYLPAGFETRERGRRVQSIKGIEAIRCSTGNLTDEEILWLEELITSPEVFIQKDGKYLPVVIADGTFETVNINKSIKQLHIELELANDLVLQRI